MLKKIFIDNYKCFRDFSFDLSDHHSLLLLGRNGAGKSALVEVLALLQKIARGEGQLENLFGQDSMVVGTEQADLRISVTVNLDGADFTYTLTLEPPQGFFTWRVKEEVMTKDGREILARELASVTLSGQSKFDMDWHQIALPVIFKSRNSEEIFILKDWLSKMYLLKPAPMRMEDTCIDYPKFLDIDCENLPGYLMGIFATDYSMFEKMRRYVTRRMPDLVALKGPEFGVYRKRLEVAFNGMKKDIPFSQLSDGEKLYILQGMLVALASCQKDMLVFWDEPDNFIALAEVQGFIRELRAAFSRDGQLVITSHSPVAAQAFTRDSVLALYRTSHAESPRVIKVPEDADYSTFVENIEPERG